MVMYPRLGTELVFVGLHPILLHYSKAIKEFDPKIVHAAVVLPQNIS
jgi:hypothetical protein